MKSNRILLLEDDAGTAKTLSDGFAKIEVEVITCESVDTALARLKFDRAFEATIIDYKISGSAKDGSHFAHIIRQRFPDMIRVFYSSMFDEAKAQLDMEMADVDLPIPKRLFGSQEEADSFVVWLKSEIDKKIEFKNDNRYVRIEKFNIINGQNIPKNLLIHIDQIRKFQSNSSETSNSIEITYFDTNLDKEVRLEYKTNIGAFVQQVRELCRDEFPFHAINQSTYLRKGFKVADYSDPTELIIDGDKFFTSPRKLSRFLSQFLKFKSRLKKGD